MTSAAINSLAMSDTAGSKEEKLMCWLIFVVLFLLARYDVTQSSV